MIIIIINGNVYFKNIHFFIAFINFLVYNQYENDFQIEKRSDFMIDSLMDAILDTLLFYLLLF